MRRTVAAAAGLIGVMLVGAGCDGGGGGLSDEEVLTAVRAKFDAANEAGRTGLLMKGRTGVVWWEAGMFDKACIEQKDLAFNDDPISRPAGSKSIARISPTYINQWGIVASTPTGYCLDLGADPKMEFTSEPEWALDRYKVDVKISMGTPTPWFECLEQGAKERTVEITVDEASGQPSVETALDLFQGDCPHPVPVSAPRKSRTEPVQPAPQAPSAAEVKALAEKFDAALAEGDAAAALKLLSCYNLFEEKQYGNCSTAEVIAHGSVKEGQTNPWLEYALTDFGELSGRPQKDREKDNMFHIPFKHKRNGNTRSISVQWVSGEWKLVGIVSQKAEGITVARIVNDLHDREKRDIFRRRMEGEEIDYRGEPINPNAEEEQ